MLVTLVDLNESKRQVKVSLKIFRGRFGANRFVACESVHSRMRSPDFRINTNAGMIMAPEIQSPTRGMKPMKDPKRKSSPLSSFPPPLFEDPPPSSPTCGRKIMRQMGWKLQEVLIVSSVVRDMDFR